VPPSRAAGDRTQLKLMRASGEQASCIPARSCSDIKAAAHAQIFNLLA
jgi:hypothetical protein